MPLQNRVTPEGDIVAVAARGTMMGNRGGCFHRADQTLKARHWANAQWLCCVLAFKGRRRPAMMQPGLYTELFFLDEATALSAGHRPCFECRRADAKRFASLWAIAHGLDAPPKAPDMDAVLHPARIKRERWTSRLNDLPDGVFVTHNGRPHLSVRGYLLPWSHEGYGQKIKRAAGPAHVGVLTPRPTAAVIAAGYQPMLHPLASNALD
jgi:hypothetical protein